MSINYQLTRKSVAKRLFSGVAGSPLAHVIEEPVAVSVVEPSERRATDEDSNSSQSSPQFQAAVTVLMEAVEIAQTDAEVRKVVQAAFGETRRPQKTRGRPRKWASEAERKKSERDRAAINLQTLLFRCGILSDTPIPPGLKTKFGVTCNTFDQLLKQDGIAAKVFKDFVRELKIIGLTRKSRDGVYQDSGPSTRNFDFIAAGNGNQAPAMIMRDAPQGCGKVITGGYGSRSTKSSQSVEEMIGIREERARALSKPGDEDFQASGDRRKVQPQGHGPDESE
jgi:hypothetical protein